MTAILELPTRVARVTVYRNGALVVREGAIPAGSALPLTVQIPGLPLLLSGDSLRLRLGDAGVRAGALEEVPALQVTGGRTPEDARTLRELQKQRAVLDREQAAWRAMAGVYDRLQVEKVREEQPTLPDVAPWLALVDLAGEGAERCAAEQARLTTQAQELDRRIQALQLHGETQVVALASRTLQTTLAGEAEGVVGVEVEYFVPGARWAPVYRVHVDTVAGRARLWMGAQLAQATGEDWRGVPLSFSTADLRRDSRLPEPASWRIGRAAPQRPAWRPLPEDIDSLFADFDAAPHRPAPEGRAPLPPQGEPEPVWGGGAADDEPTTASFFPPPPMQAIAHLGAMPEGAAAAPAAMPAAAMDMARPAPPRMAAPLGARRAGPSAGGAPPIQSLSAPVERAEAAPMEPPALDPGKMLDYAWLRLALAEQRGRRGRLLPVTLVTELREILEERGASPTQWQRVRDALAELQRRQVVFGRVPLPAGCVDVAGASFQHRYPPSAAVDVPSDARFYAVAIAEAEAPCRLVHRAVPRQEARAFRFARLENPLRWPLLDGPLQVYLDGEYIVTSRLPSTGTSGELRLNLGAEESIRIARNAEFRQSEQGLLSSSSVLDTSVRTEIRSRLPRAARLEIFERLPQADGVDGVALKLEEAAPAPARDQGPDGATPGALRWEIDLPPGGSAEVRYRYTVTIAARKELVGGNRREP